MPKPQSSLKAIIAQVIIELKKLKTANGYATNIEDTSITKRYNDFKGMTAIQYPCCYLTFVNSSSELYPTRSVKREATLTLLFKFRVQQNEAACDLAADLETDLEYLFSQNIGLVDEDGNRLASLTKVGDVKTDRGLRDGETRVTVDLIVSYHTGYQ